MDIKPNSQEEIALNTLVYSMIKEGQERIGLGKTDEKHFKEKYGLSQIEKDKLFYVLFGVLKVLLNDYEIKPK